MERRTELIEIATDTEGRELWRKPYEFSCLSAPGELITENWVTYSCVSSVRVGDEIRTILKYESSAKPTDRRATEPAKRVAIIGPTSPEAARIIARHFEERQAKQPAPASPPAKRVDCFHAIPTPGCCKQPAPASPPENHISMTQNRGVDSKVALPSAGGQQVVYVAPDFDASMELRASAPPDTPAPSTPGDSREQFEKWAQSREWNIACGPVGYDDIRVHWAWYAWQAASAAARKD